MDITLTINEVLTPPLKELEGSERYYLEPLRQDEFDHFFQKGVLRARDVKTSKDIFDWMYVQKVKFESRCVEFVQSLASDKVDRMESAQFSLAMHTAKELGFRALIYANKVPVAF